MFKIFFKKYLPIFIDRLFQFIKLAQFVSNTICFLSCSFFGNGQNLLFSQFLATYQNSLISNRLFQAI